MVIHRGEKAFDGTVAGLRERIGLPVELEVRFTREVKEYVVSPDPAGRRTPLRLFRCPAMFVRFGETAGCARCLSTGVSARRWKCCAWWSNGERSRMYG